MQTLIWLLALSNLSYFWLRHDNPTYLIALLIIQGTLWMLLWHQRKRISTPILWIAIGVAFLCARFSLPFFEDDYFRYFWDGYQSWETGNPYAQAPAQIEHSRFPYIQNQINYPELVTFYPPLAQGLFFVLFCFSLGSLPIFLHLLASGGALFFGYAFYRLQQAENNLASQWLPLLLLHPLIIKEWYQSVHYDPWFVATLCLAFARKAWLPFWLAAGSLFKFTTTIALLFIPAQNTKLWFKSVGIFLLCFSIPWWLLWDSSFSLWKTLGVFGSHWEMNSGVFRWVLLTLEKLDVDNTLAQGFARAVYAGLWGTSAIFLYFSKCRRLEKVFWCFFLLVWLSPVPNCWYFTWSIPFVFFLPEPRRTYALLAFIPIPLSYAFYLPPNLPFSSERLWDLEHLFILTCLILCYRSYVREYKARSRRGSCTQPVLNNTITQRLIKILRKTRLG